MDGTLQVSPPAKFGAEGRIVRIILIIGHHADEVQDAVLTTMHRIGLTTLNTLSHYKAIYEQLEGLFEYQCYSPIPPSHGIKGRCVLFL